MRKTLAVVLTALVALVAAGAAQADPIQSIEAKISPKKLDKKKYKPAKIYVEIITGLNSEDEVRPLQPPSATNTKVNFSKNIRFNTKAVPNCEVNAEGLDQTTTEMATELCGKKSIVSVGSGVPTSAASTKGTSAWVTADIGASAIEVPVVVTAFNGKKKNTIYLHARADTVNTTSILTGKLRRAPKGYGTQLDVTIPPLLAGAIARFTATVKAKKYVQARCKQRKMKYEAITEFTNHDTVSDKYSHKCKRKKSRKRGKGNRKGKGKHKNKGKGKRGRN